MDAKQAAQILSMLAHIVLHHPRYAPDVLASMTTLLDRFHEPGPAMDALGAFCEEGLEVLVGILLRWVVIRN
jgi:hypothetical protein